MPTPLIKTTDLCRYFRRGSHQVRAIDRLSLAIARGEFLAVVGASGSGKSTLLAMLAGLDSPTSGTVEIGGRLLNDLSRRQLAAYRAERVGMIFQSFNLIGHRTAQQNVELALYFNHTPRRERERKAIETLERLGLGDRLDHRPADLSGGEQQRVAIARALVKNPDILFADEPTGNLDYDHSRQIVALLSELNTQGITVIMVTHNTELAAEYAHRTVRLVYGRLAEDAGR